MAKLAELEEAAWGQKATEAMAQGEMVGMQVFTNALTKIANGEA
jgi:hypothetical protein